MASKSFITTQSTHHREEPFIGRRVPSPTESAPATPTTARIEQSGIRWFALRVFLFLTPLALAIGGNEFLLWRVGETWPLERVIRFQELNPRSFFARGVLDQSTFRYKYLQILR